MTVQRLRLTALACAGVLALGAAAGAAPASAGTGTSARDTGAVTAAAATLPTSPAGRISVMTENAAEVLHGVDIGESIDIDHFGYRVQSVLAALNARGPAVPNYAPDVVLLQEVAHESVANAVSSLSKYTGYPYRVAADALPGTNACQDCDHLPRIIRETAIVYNSATMRTVGSAASSVLTYPQSEVPAGAPAKSWVTQRQSTIQLQQISSGQTYGVYSIHYRPHTLVTDHDAYTVQWTNFLKARVSQIYPNAIPIIGGDTNSTTNAWRGPLTTSTSEGPGTYNIAQPKGAGSVDIIASPLPVLTTNYDYDYKSYSDDKGTGPRANYFDNVNTFLQCDLLYGDGKGGSSDAAKIRGCKARYYSDHDFVWSVFGS